MSVTHNISDCRRQVEDFVKHLSEGVVFKEGEGTSRLKRSFKAHVGPAMVKVAKPQYLKPVGKALRNTKAATSKRRLKFMMELQAAGKGPKKSSLSWERLAPLAVPILEWVTNQKRKKSETDARKKSGRWYSDEDIAERVMATMINKPEDWFLSKNPTGLLAYLQSNYADKLAEVMGSDTPGIPDSEIDKLEAAAEAAFEEKVANDIEASIMDALTKGI